MRDLGACHPGMNYPRDDIRIKYKKQYVMVHMIADMSGSPRKVTQGKLT
jgi:hypothetical protein